MDSSQECRYLPLIVYNLDNGVSAVSVNGLNAVRNTDNGQQWVVPTAAIVRDGSDVPAQELSVEVFDIDGQSRGVSVVQLDPEQVDSDCSTGQWASRTASVSTTQPGVRLSCDALKDRLLSVQLGSHSLM